MDDEPNVIPLVEYEPKELLRRVLKETEGRALWEEYGKRIEVEFPSPKTDDKWKLTSQGWVGYIPLSPDVGISIKPKVELANIFRMLEYAYQLKSFEILEGIFNSDSLQEFYEQLANILAKRILARGRMGYYRQYLNRVERMPYITGQLEIRSHICEPWKVQPRCRYQDHTPDIDENQILAWTLFVIARSGLCSERVAPVIRKAYRSLQGFVTLMPFSPEDCLGRLYNRLNQDYQQLHALCRFFLDNSGPVHDVGDRSMMPFLVNMANLFEKFVGSWLKAHLHLGYSINIQEQVVFRKEGRLSFIIDLVIVDDETGKVKYVLDTKYKAPDRPASDDVAQAIAYAQVKQCYEAILIYPEPLNNPLDEWADDIRVRSLTFSLDDDLEEAGRQFLSELF